MIPIIKIKMVIRLMPCIMDKNFVSSKPWLSCFLNVMYDQIFLNINMTTNITLTLLKLFLINKKSRNKLQLFRIRFVLII